MEEIFSSRNIVLFRTVEVWGTEIIALHKIFPKRMARNIPRKLKNINCIATGHFRGKK